MTDTDDFIPISSLQHYLYCPRQCALIHVEQCWSESVHTAQGRILHDRADKSGVARRKNVRVMTAMAIANSELGLSGVADVVEFHQDEAVERILPVEYKRGRPKAHQADEVQLCAQALCLEEMLGTAIERGALFYGETRRRHDVVFSEQLRELTRATVRNVRTMLNSRRTPTADYVAKRCDACSLIDICQPRLLGHRRSVAAWLKREFDETQEPFPCAGS